MPAKKKVVTYAVSPILLPSGSLNGQQASDKCLSENRPLLVADSGGIKFNKDVPDSVQQGTGRDPTTSNSGTDYQELKVS
ncbi:hypothetical protein NPE20_14480 [Mucilaginibacter sp. JC4]|uniref:Uncharacterized protein n=1 Tax=Mucilaginibacter aquariorum TaxID=2967225 RepID=A0ABT1T433_9SPHI|nr:hypothetical protein [Mucilaginibacter aquariorum]